MRKFTIALLTGGLVMGSAAAASAQDLATAVPTSKSEFMVFADRGAALSPTALAIIRNAASEAKSARQVTLTGRSEDVARVKEELVKQGVPAQAIVVQRDAHAPLPKAGDGLSDAADRRVEIKI
jgi:hypothetical protein